MILTLNRTHRSGDATLGDLLIEGVHECYTLEDRVRATGIKVMFHVKQWLPYDL